MFKKFLEDILSGKIKYNNIEDYEEEINDIEKDLNNLTKSKKIDTSLPIFLLFVKLFKSFSMSLISSS